MLGLGLPEGVIAPRGQLSTFLFFHTVNPKLPTVIFREGLVAVGDSTGVQKEVMLGKISIPFTVKTRRMQEAVGLASAPRAREGVSAR